MAKKNELLKNLRNYSPEEIAKAVRDGEVSFYELSKETEGAFTPLLKKKVKAILEQPEPALSNEQEYVTPNPEAPVVPPLGANEASFVGFTEVPQQTNDHTNKPKAEKAEISNKGMFKRPFSFHGRIRRTEYGISFIIYFIWAVMLNISTQSYDTPEGVAIFMLLTYIPMMWFSLAQNCKRCHDRGNSGWYQLIPFYVFVLLFGNGQEGSNEYGDNPKE